MSGDISPSHREAAHRLLAVLSHQDKSTPVPRVLHWYRERALRSVCMRAIIAQLLNHREGCAVVDDLGLLNDRGEDEALSGRAASLLGGGFSSLLGGSLLGRRTPSQRQQRFVVLSSLYREVPLGQSSATESSVCEDLLERSMSMSVPSGRTPSSQVASGIGASVYSVLEARRRRAELASRARLHRPALLARALGELRKGGRHRSRRPSREPPPHAPAPHDPLLVPRAARPGSARAAAARAARPPKAANGPWQRLCLTDGGGRASGRV